MWWEVVSLCVADVGEPLLVSPFLYLLPSVPFAFKAQPEALRIRLYGFENYFGLVLHEPVPVGFASIITSLCGYVVLVLYGQQDDKQSSEYVVAIMAIKT